MSVLERVREREGTIDESLVEASAADELRVRLKRDLMERLGLSTVAAMASSKETGDARQELAVACQAILNSGDYERMEVASRDRLIREVLDEILGLGPLQPLLDDPTITEVMVNGCDSVFFERAGVMSETDRVFRSSEQILMAVDRILAPLGRRLDESNPIVNARLQNGDRVNVVGSPIAVSGPIVTIRRVSDRIASLSRLVELGALPGWYARLLSWAVRARKDIAVAGGTGSGKTTLLNALSCEIGHDERIVTIEDSAELRFDTHPHVVRLEARDASIEGTGAVTIRDLVKNALRMRPDRIVVGEVRGEECIDMLQAMNTGHDGSLTTLHAGSSREAILRLVLMARFGLDLPTDIIEEQGATALDIIVMSRRMPGGARVISNACLVGRREGGGVDLRKFVDFDPHSGEWRLLEVPAFVDELVSDGMLDAKEVERWRSSCLPEVA